MTAEAHTATGQVPTLSATETLAVAADVVMPVIGRGVIVRRPPVVRAAQALDLDRRAIRRLQQIDRDHGPGPVLLRTPIRDFALILDPADVKRVLSGSPEPFAAATLEKRGALGHFQPEGVLISDGPERADRRRFNEQVLGSDASIHHLAGVLLAKVVEEAGLLADHVERTGRLDWDAFVVAWFRMVRRVVLGDGAREDHAVTDLLADLRAAANWSGLRPRSTELRRRFFRQLQGHLDRAEAGSLAAVMASTPTTAVTQPAQQVPQWLFAFDAAAWATFRALALVTSHPVQAAAIREELAGRDVASPHELPSLRAAVLESLRLWPTTPAVLRDTTEETTWASGVLPAGTGVFIFAPYFHRDDRRVEYADRFAPEVWTGSATGGPELGHLTDDDWPLIPFSAGPVVCPGRNLVLLTASAMLGVLLQRGDLRPDPAQALDPSSPLPSSLSPFHLSFGRQGGPAAS
jgi:cytochrome P450